MSHTFGILNSCSVYQVSGELKGSVLTGAERLVRAARRFRAFGEARRAHAQRLDRAAHAFFERDMRAIAELTLRAVDGAGDALVHLREHVHLLVVEAQRLKALV